jgi:hypothetical protein
MAIARGAGTEIIRSAHFEEVDSNAQILIYGEQHHIYTVLSVIFFCHSVSSAGNYLTMILRGYDSKAGGDSTSPVTIFKNTSMATNSTFVWNDKFSFNGFEPVDFTGPMDDATKQNAIADQGGTVQQLEASSQNSADNYDVHITYIDQNNS